MCSAIILRTLVLAKLSKIIVCDDIRNSIRAKLNECGDWTSANGPMDIIDVTEWSVVLHAYSSVERFCWPAGTCKCCNSNAYFGISCYTL